MSIRVTQHRQIAYLPTGLYVSKKQINSKTFEIKDQFVIERTNKTIRDYEKVILSMEQQDLLNSSVTQLKALLMNVNNSPDYLYYCEHLKQYSGQNAALRNALRVIREDMGIRSMRASDFTSAFLNRFKEALDNKEAVVVLKTKDGEVVHGKGKLLSITTKNNYLKAICAAFRQMKREVNTEYYQLIRHDPFVGFEFYPKVISTKKQDVLTVEELRELFKIDYLTDTQRRTMEILKLSFCMCAVNTADLLTMRKECYNEKSGRVTYSRKKTKAARADQAVTSVKIEPEIRDIFEKYRAKSGDYLFDFGYSRKSTQTFARKLGANLTEACKRNHFKHVNPYMLRHTFATIARNDLGMSKDDVDLLLNHVGNNPMADAYIAVSWDRNDINNRKILDYVFHMEGWEAMDTNT